MSDAITIIIVVIVVIVVNRIRHDQKKICNSMSKNARRQRPEIKVIKDKKIENNKLEEPI